MNAKRLFFFIENGKVKKTKTTEDGWFKLVFIDNNQPRVQKGKKILISAAIKYIFTQCFPSLRKVLEQHVKELQPFWSGLFSLFPGMLSIIKIH